MKRLTVASLLIVSATLLPAQSSPKPETALASALPNAPTPASRAIRCVGLDGKMPCNAAQIGQLNQIIVANKGMQTSLRDIHSISLVGSNGTLSCVQNSGAPCTDEQTNGFIDAARKKGGGGFHVMKTMDMATP